MTLHDTTTRHINRHTKRNLHSFMVSMYRNDTLQRTATHCNTPQHTATQISIISVPGEKHAACATYCNTTHCNTLQHTATQTSIIIVPSAMRAASATHGNTLQHTATHCNTPQNRPQSSSCQAQCAQLLQHTATQSNTPQHTATQTSIIIVPSAMRAA